ncbi:esterase [Mycolicibacterium tusciae]|uniref:Immunogenic protein MPB64/MPT64 n=1 Tax=Mycolicibacterium tusciae TaxID=75922 RepID=A0A1X0JUT3_9MYCO|nr:esterase [Mycolicibacterium tusciae]ORB66683.1 immunogenic protein MPB64/MPT64 precursor [Mycolicibacterium tusciae]
MKKRHLVIAVAVILTVAACDSSTEPAPSEAVTTPPTTSTSGTATTSAAPTATAAGSSACTELEGTVGDAGLCTVHTETPDYTIDMSFPVDYPDQDAVEDVLTDQRDEFIDLVEEQPARDVPKALDIKSRTFRSGAPGSGTESLVFEEYVNFGGAHPVTNYDALNYDLGKKAPITFDELFKPEADPVAMLDRLVAADLEKQLPSVTVGDNPIGARMYKNFALTDDAVLFFLSQGQWTISAAGPRTVSIPRTELASILA